MQHIATYDGRAVVYTDGSKTSDGVGCAFVAGGDTRSFSLPASASVFSAELTAIDKALCFIEVCDEALHLILTDSMSNLLAIRRFMRGICRPTLQSFLYFPQLCCSFFKKGIRYCNQTLRSQNNHLEGNAYLVNAGKTWKGTEKKASKFR